MTIIEIEADSGYGRLEVGGPRWGLYRFKNTI